MNAKITTVTLENDKGSKVQFDIKHAELLLSVYRSLWHLADDRYIYTNGSIVKPCKAEKKNKAE